MSDEESELYAIWLEALRDWGDAGPNNNCLTVMEDWHQVLLDRAEADPRPTLAVFRNECRQATRVLSDLRRSLTYYVTEDHWTSQLGVLWHPLPDEWLSQHPPHWQRASPVDRGGLTLAVQRYLDRPWLQHRAIDWSVINGTLFNEASDLRTGIISGLLFHKTDWAYLVAGHDEFRRVLWRAAFDFLGFSVRWAIPPLAVLLLIYTGRGTIAGILGALWGVYVLARIAGGLFGGKARRARKNRRLSVERIYDSISRCWLFANSRIVHPTRLREMLVEVDEKEEPGAVVPGILYAVLDRAIERDPYLLSLPEGRR